MQPTKTFEAYLNLVNKYKNLLELYNYLDFDSCLSIDYDGFHDKIHYINGDTEMLTNVNDNNYLQFLETIDYCLDIVNWVVDDNDLKKVKQAVKDLHLNNVVII